MYPIHDTDAQLLLATLIAAKRRPAALADIVAAAEFMGFPVTAPALRVGRSLMERIGPSPC